MIHLYCCLGGKNMKTKSMVPFWVVGGLTIAMNLFVAIMMSVVIFGAIQNIDSFEEIVPIIVDPGLLIWRVLSSIIGTISFVMGIVHLVFYSGNKFTNNESKVTHALYQFFFGLGLIGLIITLVINPQGNNTQSS